MACAELVNTKKIEGDSENCVFKDDFTEKYVHLKGGHTFVPKFEDFVSQRRCHFPR